MEEGARRDDQVRRKAAQRARDRRPRETPRTLALRGGQGQRRGAGGSARAPARKGRSVARVLGRVGCSWIPLRRGAGRRVVRKNVCPWRARLPARRTLRWHRLGDARSASGPPHRGGGEPYALGELRGLPPRSEEHTSELQSRQYLVCRLLLEKKNNTTLTPHIVHVRH